MAYGQDYENPYYRGAQRPPVQPQQPQGFPGYEDTGAFQKWYGQQQGGARPEDMARFGWTGNEEGQGNQSNETFKRWDPYLQKEGPNAGKYRSMRGAEGYFDKPTECPEGMVPGGPNETDGCVPAGQGQRGGGGQGGAGGRGAGGSGGSGGGGSDEEMYYRYLGQQAKGALEDPTGRKSFELLAGQGGEQQFQQQIDQARKQLALTPEGPQRAALENQIKQMEIGLPLQMRTAATGAARGMLGEQVNPQINWLSGQNALAENARQANMGNALGWYGATNSYNLGSRGLGLQEGAQNWQQNVQFPTEQANWGKQFTEGQRQFNQNLGFQNQQMKNQQKTSLASGLMGGLFGLGAAALSDVRVKDNIGPGRRGLSDLMKLGVFSYGYIPEVDPKGKRRQGIMAQDLEKVAPEMVEEIGGVKAVDTYSILSMTVQAVQELAREVERRKF
jgi:hypothetical protein